MINTYERRNPSDWWAVPVGLLMGGVWLSLAGYTFYSRFRPQRKEKQ